MGEWLNKTVVIGSHSLPFSMKDLLLRFAVPVVGMFLAVLIISIVIRRISTRYVKEERRHVVLLWSRRLVRLMLVLGIILAATSLMGAQAWKAFGNFFRILNTPFFSSGNTAISVVTLILIIPVVAVASWTGRLVDRGLQARPLKRFGLDAEQSFTIGRLLRYVVMVLVFLFGFSIIGIDLSVIGVLFGVLGIGIGFGLQSVVADFFAGITLISMGLLKEGDRIRVDDFDGIIKRIRLMNTELLTFENETLIIPNSHLTGGTIHNFSYKDRSVVIVNEVDVSYNSNLDEVSSVLRTVAEKNPWLQPSSNIFVRVMNFADSGITMQLRTWIRDVADRADAMSWTNMEIWRSFKNSGIEIPFPQRVVHMAEPSPMKDDFQPSPEVSAVDVVAADPRILDDSGESDD